MTCHSQDIRITTTTCVAGMAILMATVSCDSTGPLPEVPAAPIAAITRGQMVFVDQSSSAFSIFLADSNGTKLKNLTTGWDAFDPAVSADGKRIAFSRSARTDYGPDIWVMNADGSNQVRLTHTADANGSSGSPAWSPDGKRIAFVTSTGVWEHQIFVMNADGTDVQQLTDEEEAYSLSPEWSPDGSRILYSHFANHAENGGIFEMNADGSNVRQLTSGYWATEPTRSPDATRIAFISGQSLFVVNADGSNATALASGFDWEGHLTWSPDGKSIVFGINSSSKVCLDWDFEDYACGRDLKRVSLEGIVDPAWQLLSAFSLVWQR